MATAAANQTRRRMQWWLAALTIIALLLNAPLARRLPMLVQNFAFQILVFLLVLFIGMAWWQFSRVRRDKPGWRMWISLCGCIAFSLSIVIPVLAMLPLSVSWDFLTAWMLTSLVSLLLSPFAAPGVRFPLVLGSFAMLGFVVVIPKGIL
jgi:hypothetical protein